MDTTAPSLEKMNDTVQKLRKIVGEMDGYSQPELNRAEDVIRNEFQVIEAMIAYVGRDIYAIAQKRRMALRTQNIQKIQKITSDIRKEMSSGNGDSGTSGDTGVGDRADKPSRSKRKSDSKTSKSA